jgi:hypothetical protein
MTNGPIVLGNHPISKHLIDGVNGFLGFTKNDPARCREIEPVAWLRVEQTRFLLDEESKSFA